MIVVLNLIFNLLTIFLFGFSFNNCKGIRDKSTYPFVLISYLLCCVISNFSYNNLIYAYIILAIIFSLLRSFKEKGYNVLNMLLMLNIALFYSTITALPILLLGYSYITLYISYFILIVFTLILKLYDFSKSYYNVYSCWNRESGNKYKSITVRNFTLISIYTGFILINIFVVYYFNNVYLNF